MALSDTDLAFAGVVEQARLVASGEVSSRDLTDLYLARIEALDPQLNAYRVVLADHARAAADQADARRRAGDERPLLGVPIAIKDDMDLAGEVTTYGSIAHGPPVARDHEMVAALRRAGAVVLGKTQVPELMTMPFTESTWYGVTRNPWDPDRTPGGSSGGSAAAVAAGLAPAATATDGAGSIRIPAGACGLVGLKCQHGRIPATDGWQQMNHYGFVTRTVADTALLCDVVKSSGPSFTAAAGREPGSLRIAISAKVPLGIHAKPDATTLGALDDAERILDGLGHSVARRDPDLGLIGPKVVARYLAGIATDARELPHPERLGTRARNQARIGSLIPEAMRRTIREGAAADRDRVGAIFRDADVLVMPIFTRLPMRIGEIEGAGAVRSVDAAVNFVPYPALCNHTGQPAIAVPIGTTPDGFPLAVQLIAPPDGEEVLLSLAAQLESAIGWPDRRPPLAAAPSSVKTLTPERT